LDYTDGLRGWILWIQSAQAFFIEINVREIQSAKSVKIIKSAIKCGPVKDKVGSKILKSEIEEVNRKECGFQLTNLSEKSNLCNPIREIS